MAVYKKILEWQAAHPKPRVRRRRREEQYRLHGGRLD
jgi:hypothetical protein